ncbi:MAG: hypothetical protein Q9166_003995 [cf. Caloplaca sp. 2 TL-2023]
MEAEPLKSQSLVTRDITVSDDAPNAPSAENFLRRGFHASVTVGDYIYIDGGEILQLPLIDGDPSSPTGHRLNVTLSIDMSKSWTNSTVTFKEINKGNAPLLNRQLIWPSTDNQSFFAFGGSLSFWVGSNNIPDVVCWQFTVDGSGGGSWDKFNPGDDSIFHRLRRPDAAGAATVDNTGFIYGGFDGARSTPGISVLSGVHIPGIVSFNITSGLWNNDTLPEYIENLNAPQGMLASVPLFGPSGLLIQAFLYGGSTTPNYKSNMTLNQYKENIALDAVYVLSLPAFVWFKADYPAQHPRHLHTCNVVGNRQMISIGGYDPTNSWDDTQTPEVFSQGLGIFDLTAMQWSDRYDANAEAYETPAVVKAWYNANGTSPRTWDDPAVQRLFDSGGSAETPSDPTTPAPPAAPSAKPKSMTGAITGGVVGGIVALAILVALGAWCFRQRKSRNAGGVKHSTPEYQAQGDYVYQKPELSAKEKPYPHEMSNDYRPYEMDGAHSAVEMESAYFRAELEGQAKPHPHLTNSTSYP